MVRISKYEREQLDKFGLIKYRRTGMNPQDATIQVTNKEHVSRDKTYYVTEEPQIMKFLGKFENLNMQKINKTQLKSLMDANMATKDNIQNAGEYKPEAFIYVKENGIILMDKVRKCMLFLGIWKQNNRTY